MGSSNFNFESMIKAPNNGPGDKFGSSVAISENIIAIGAPYEDSDQKGIFNSSTLADNNSMSDSGAVYIFSYDGTALSFTHYLKANTVFDRDHFGFPLALAGRTLLVGTPDLDDTRNYIDNSIYYEDAGQNCPSSSFYCNSGGAIIYEVDASEIRHVALIRPSNNENNFSNSLLGSAISIDDFGNIVLGASQEHNSSQAVLNLESAPVTNILPSKFFGAVYIYKK